MSAPQQPAPSGASGRHAPELELRGHCGGEDQQPGTLKNSWVGMAVMAVMAIY